MKDQKLQRALQIKMMLNNAGKINQCLEFPYTNQATVGQGIDFRGNIYPTPLLHHNLENIVKVIYKQGKESLQLRFSASSDTLQKSLDFFVGINQLSYIFTAHGHFQLKNEQIKDSRSVTAHLFHFKDHFSKQLNHMFRGKDKKITFRPQVIKILQSKDQEQAKKFFELYGTHILVRIDYAFSFYGKIQSKETSHAKKTTFSEQIGSGPKNGKVSQKTQKTNQKLLKQVKKRLGFLTGFPKIQGSQNMTNSKTQSSINYEFSFDCKTAGVTTPILRATSQKDLWHAYLLYLNQVHIKTKTELFSKQQIQKIRNQYFNTLLHGADLEQGFKGKQAHYRKKMQKWQRKTQEDKQKFQQQENIKLQTQIQQLKSKINQLQQNKNESQNMRGQTNQQINPEIYAKNQRMQQNPQDQLYQQIQQENAEPYLMIALPWHYFLDELQIGLTPQSAQQTMKTVFGPCINFEEKLQRANYLSTSLQNPVKKELSTLHSRQQQNAFGINSLPSQKQIMIKDTQRQRLQSRNLLASGKDLQQHIKQLNQFSAISRKLSCFQIEEVKKKVYGLLKKFMNQSDYEMSALIIVMSYDLDDFVHEIICHYQYKKQYFRLKQLYEALKNLRESRAKNFALDNLYVYRQLNFCQKLIRTIFCCCYRWEPQYFQTIRFGNEEFDKHNKKIHNHHQDQKFDKKQQQDEDDIVQSDRPIKSYVK